MEQLVSSPVFRMYIGAVVALAANVFVLANLTAITRARRNEAINPEDKKLNPKAEVVFYDGNATTQRVRRAHANAMENVPLFLITGFLLTLTDVSTVAAGVLFGVFVAFRLLHSVAYVRSLQPLRTASFGIASLDQYVLIGFLCHGVFAAG